MWAAIIRTIGIVLTSLGIAFDFGIKVFDAFQKVIQNSKLFFLIFFLGIAYFVYQLTQGIFDNLTTLWDFRNAEELPSIGLTVFNNVLDTSVITTFLSEILSLISTYVVMVNFGLGVSLVTRTHKILTRSITL